MRQYTAAYFTATNPILQYEEVGFETDTTRIKYGDGLTAWNSLSSSGLLLIGNHIEPETKDSFQELTFTGAINNVNTVYVFSSVPLQIYWNGQLLKLGVGYTLAGSTATFTNPPFTGDSVSGYGNN